jgi:hypothetical protein
MPYPYFRFGKMPKFVDFMNKIRLDRPPCRPYPGGQGGPPCIAKISSTIRLAAPQPAAGLSPYMKHRLLQKCSFFLIKLGRFLASGAARMKLHL